MSIGDLMNETAQPDYARMTYTQLRVLVEQRFPERAADMPPLGTLSDDDLALWAAYMYVNCAPVRWRAPRPCYDDALIADVVPEMIRRLAAKAGP